MSSQLRLAALSLDIMPGDKQYNMQLLGEHMASLSGDVDLVVVPELFSTGFVSDGERLGQWAETNGGETVAQLHRLAAAHNVAIAGSFLAKTGSALCNRAFFIEPSGDEMFYDKRHLFSMSSESRLLSAGDRPMPVVRYRGWNIAVAVCYDLRFPVWCRNVGLSYDLLIFVANWPKEREYAWKHLLIARAIENQAFVAGVDRGGVDKFGLYDGMTFIADFCGQSMPVDRSPAVPGLETVVLDHGSLDRWRKDFAVWQDADRFNVELS